MSVKVRIHPILRRFVGGRDMVETTGKTVGECLDNLDIEFPGIKGLYIGLSLSDPDELSRPVKDGDELSISVAIGGG